MKEKTESTTDRELIPSNQPVYVQCDGFRALAYQDDTGAGKNYFNKTLIAGVVKRVADSTNWIMKMPFIPEEEFTFQHFCRINEPAKPLELLRFLTEQVNKKKITRKHGKRTIYILTNCL